MAEPAKKSTDDQFAARFKDARTQLGLSQEQVAESMARLGHTHIRTSAVGKIERGERRVTVGEAAALASVVNINLADLLDTENPIHLRLSALNASEISLRAAAEMYTRKLIELAQSLEASRDLLPEDWSAFWTELNRRTPAAIAALTAAKSNQIGQEPLGWVQDLRSMLRDDLDALELAAEARRTDVSDW